MHLIRLDLPIYLNAHFTGISRWLFIPRMGRDEVVIGTLLKKDFGLIDFVVKAFV